MAAADAPGIGAGPKEKLAASVARAIEDDIVAAGWPVGSVLGSESALVARHGVSRAVFREAIRLVEHHQVAVMRRGPSGGLVVKAPDAVAAVNASIVYLEFIGSTVDDLLQARLLLEPMAAVVAAENITEEGIKSLRAAAEHAEFAAEPNRPLTHGQLHIKLAELSGNPALYLFVEVLVQLTERYAKLRRTTKAERVETDKQVDHVHRALIDAVVAGDAASAQHYMIAHMEAMRHWFSGTSRRITSSRSAVARATANSRKLAEVIADEIHEDIARDGCRIGEVMGSEGDLVERYEVSRAVLREAVRLLEHHSIARMRRGRGGGLIVTEPDPDAGADAMALYLDYRGSTAEDLLAVRKALELGCVDSVISKVDQPATQKQLCDTLTVAPETPVEDVNRLAHELHLTLAELSGNPVLAFFLRTITSLWARHGTGEPGRSPLPPAEAAGAVSHAHAAIVEAVLAGDRGLARHRMTRHLNALPAWWH
jgi:DNA-binding FadR family transcriptional regulator